MSEITFLICGECGDGNYHKNPASASGPNAGYANCGTCGHMVSLPLDLAPHLESGESLTIADGLVGYTTTEEEM